MNRPIEVIYEDGVLKPLNPLPEHLREHQHLTVTIDEPGSAAWLADADPSVRLEDVRQALAKVEGTLSEHVHAEREDR
jgi:predicted DNA-binding antitoxin AbrB/MazE fold protein